MAQDPNPATLTGWIDVPSPCARCRCPVKVQCSKSFSRIVTIQCTKCGFRYELDPIRLAAKAQSREVPDIEEPQPGEIEPPG